MNEFLNEVLKSKPKGEFLRKDYVTVDGLTVKHCPYVLSADGRGGFFPSVVFVRILELVDDMRKSGTLEMVYDEKS